QRYEIALWNLLVTVMPLFVLAISSGFAFTFGSTNTAISGLGIALMVVAFVFVIAVAIMNMGASLYAATRLEHTTYWDGVTWIRGHFWSFLWIQLLVTLSVLGGLFVFVIPGIALMVYLAFSQVVLIHEGSSGTASLKRSWQLVYSNWWAVFGRLVAVMIIVMVVGAIGEVSALLLGPLAAVVSMVLGSFTTIFTFHALGSLYRGLHALSEPAAVPAPGQ
ncbi:MAG: hypothetical protein AAFO91_07265, partial [Bacteroidota bacterium]